MLLNCGVGEDSRESLWTARRSNQSILKEISPEYSLERLMLKLQYFWSPDAKSWLLWKDPDAGKHWWQEEKGTTEDEMVGWHHQLNGHKLEQAPRVGDGQGGLACCSPWGCKELDMTELLNWTDVRNQYQMIFEKIPHIFKCSATFIKRDLRLSHWKPQEG